MTTFTGFGTRAGAALRRERVRLALWVGALVVLMAASSAQMAATYQTPAERAAAARLLATNPALLMLRGPASDASTGALVMSEMAVILAVLAGLMSAFAVVRHTRQDEETGRAELIGAGVVGRHASLSAALTVTVGANVVLAVLLGVVLAARGLPAPGSLLAGAAVGATGIVFAGGAAVAAQLSASARVSNGLAASAVGVAYLLRGAGDVLGDVAESGLTVVAAWPSGLSPIGWAQQVQPFSDADPRPLALHGVLFAVTVGMAFALTNRRDFDAGLLPARRGPVVAGRTLRGPLGLAWRLQRGVLVAWTVGLAVAGAVFGSVGQQVDSLAQTNPQFAQTLRDLAGAGTDPTETFFAAMLPVIGAIASGFAVQALLRLRSEESAGHVEAVLAAAVSRTRWIASHLVWAAAGTVVVLLATGVSMGTSYGLVAGNIAPEVASLAIAALVQVPAALTVAAFAVAAFALLPRSSAALAWGGYATAVLLGPLGEILDLPDAMRDLSPFTHLPAVPAADVTAAPVAAILAAATLLTTAGLVRFQRRDLAL